MLTLPSWLRGPRVPALLTAAILLLFVVDVLSWVSRSEVWMHMDGVIHFQRMQTFAEAMEGKKAGVPLDPIVGYGPVVYIVGGFFMFLGGAHTVAAAIKAMLVFAVIGGAGTALLAARLGGVWCAPVAAALLLGLPVWRTHTLDLMVDLPAVSLAALAMGLLAWSDGLTRRSWLAGAALVTGLALSTRWPVAFLLAPLWAFAVLHAGWASTRRVLPTLAGANAVGLVTAGLVILPVVMLHGAKLVEERVAATLVVGALGALMLLRPPRRFPPWLARCLGAGILLGAATLPVTLWASAGLTHALADQLRMESDAYHGAGGDLELLTTLWRAARVLLLWQTGPTVLVAGAAGLLMALIGRWAPWPGVRPLTGVLTLAGVVNVMIILVVMGQPDERHMLASLPVLVALAGALPGLLPRLKITGRWPGVALGAALGLVGVLGVSAWQVPGLPGVVAAEPWHRDVNLMREEEAEKPLSSVWQAPWASLAPFQGSEIRRVTAALAKAAGGKPACIAWLIENRAREALKLNQAANEISAQLHQLRSEMQLEDPMDRPAVSLTRYDGIIVVEKTGEANLLARAKRALPKARQLMVVRHNKLTLTALLNPGGLSNAGCDGRFPGTRLLPLGQGWRENPEPGVPEGLPD